MMGAMRLIPLACLLAVGTGCLYISDTDHQAKLDADGDGVPFGQDCDPDDGTVWAEREWFEDADQDGFGGATSQMACHQPDGYVEVAGDCNESSASVHPDAPDFCNGVDDNCSGGQDDEAEQTWYRDADGDGFGDDADTVDACEQPDGYVLAGGDCADDSVLVHPQADEVCSGDDEDCDGLVDGSDPDFTGEDALWFADVDQDGFGDDASTVASCSNPGDHVRIGGDCDDAAAGANPDAVEVCDGLDNDCDGDVDDDDASLSDGQDWFADSDMDGHGDPLVSATGCQPDTGDWVGDADDCDDDDNAVNPDGVEVCNGVDDDCDGDIDDDDADTLLPPWYADVDGDTYGDASVSQQGCEPPDTTGWTDNDQDCDDASPGVNPQTAWYPDADNDGYGDDSATPTIQCEAPAGLFRPNGGDCDDTRQYVSPEEQEACSAFDDDCDPSTLDPNYSVGRTLSYDEHDDALDAAQDGDTIHICKAVTVGVWEIDKDLILQGHGSPRRVLDGASVPGFPVITHAGGALTIDNVEINGGTGIISADDLDQPVGGGIFTAGTLLTVRESVIRGNSAFRGAGLYSAYTGEVRLENVTIEQNSASSAGGGAWIRGSNVVLEGSTVVQDNSAATVGGGFALRNQATWDGGLVASNDAPNASGAQVSQGAEVHNTVFEGNTSAVSAVQLDGLAQTRLVDVTIRDHTTTGLLVAPDSVASIEGGLIHDNVVTGSRAGASIGLNALVTFDGTQFVDNVAVDRAGALGVDDGVVIELFDVVFDGNRVTGTNKNGGAVGLDDGVSFDCIRCFWVGNVATRDGGALFTPDSAVIDVTLLDNTFDGNAAEGGAALWLGQNTVARISDSTFVANTAGQWGGALETGSDDVEINGGTFDSNTAQDGGALYVSAGGLVTVTGPVQLIDNVATDDGGAATANGGAIIFDNVTVRGNSAADMGGAVAMFQDAEVEFINSLIEGNQTSNHGGAVALGNDLNGSMTLDLTNTRLEANIAGASGGAVYSDGDHTIRATDAVFEGNTASVDGGAIAGPGFVTGSRADFLDNSAAGRGGAMYIFDSPGAPNWSFDLGSVQGNSAGTASGGGVAVWGGGVSFTNTTFGSNVPEDIRTLDGEVVNGAGTTFIYCPATGGCTAF